MPQPGIVKKRKWSKVNWAVFNKDFKECGAEEWVTSCEDIDTCAQIFTAACRVHIDTQEKVKTMYCKNTFVSTSAANPVRCTDALCIELICIHQHGLIKGCILQHGQIQGAILRRIPIC